MKIGRYAENSEMRKIIDKVYFAYFTFVDRPQIFDEVNELNEVDQLHTQLFNQDPNYYNQYKSWFATEDEFT